MPWTVLNCDRIDFNSTENDNVSFTHNDTWQPAKVSVIAMSEHDHWLMIRTEREPMPTVWRAIKDSWIVACNEQSMTMLLQYPGAEGAAKTILKLRFGSLREFWTFAAQSTFARIQVQSIGWGEAGYANSEPSSLGGALAGTSL